MPIQCLPTTSCSLLGKKDNPFEGWWLSFSEIKIMETKVHSYKYQWSVMAELPCPHMPSSHCLTSLIFFLYTFFKRAVYTHCFHVFTSQPVLNLLKSHLWPYQLIELNFARITADLHATKFNGHSSFSKSLGNADSVLSLETLPFLGFHENSFFPTLLWPHWPCPPGLLGWLFLLHPTFKSWDSSGLRLGSSLSLSKVLS